MKRQFVILAMLITMISLVSASSFTFKQNDYVNYHFICLDTSGNYCSTATPLTISIDDRNGTNIISNDSMTPNPTYFNYSLPTSNVGNGFHVLIVANGNNATSEFTYDVTPTGDNRGYAFAIFIGLLGFILLGFGLFQRNEYLGLFAGFMFIIVGIYTMIYGFGNLADVYTRMVAYISIGLGLIISFASMIEMFDGGESDD